MTHHRTGSPVQALAALVGIVAFVLGLPILLSLIGQVPDPSTWTLQGFLDLWTTPDDGTVFLTALTGVAWAGWLVFTLLIAIEVIAHVRKQPTVRIPGMSWAQGLAAGLVSTVVVGLSSGTAMAATPTAVPVQEQVTVQPMAAATDTTTTQAEKAPESAAEASYTVQSGDTYWSIAEIHLGKGERYTEIIDLNQGQVMGDGVVLTGDEYPHPGWELRLPADAAPGTPAEPEAETVHTVRSGETLSGIADQHLGDATAYPQLFDANVGEPQEVGGSLTDPNIIHVGWQLSIPEPGSPSEPEDEPEVEETSAPTNDNDQNDEEVDLEAPNDPQNGTENTFDSEVHPQAVDELLTPPPAPDEEVGLQGSDEITLEATLTADDSEAPALLTAPLVGFSALTATAVAALLARRRHVQMTRRRPGQRITQPSEPELLQAEEDLHTTADPASIELLDRALRSLSAKCASTETTLPDLVGARLTATTCELLVPEGQGIPVTPFRRVDDTTWRLDTDSPALLDIERAREIPSPYPALTTIGQDTEHRQLFLNLSQIGAVGLQGEQVPLEEILTAIAVELSTSPAADHVNVNCIGVTPDLDRLVKTGRVRTFATVEDCLRELESQTLEYVSAGPSDDMVPEIMLSAVPMSAGHLSRLGSILGSQAAPPIALVAAETDDCPLPGHWHLDADLPDAQPLPWPTAGEVTVHRITAAEYADLAALLTTAEVAVSVPAPGWEQVPQEPATAVAAVSGPTGGAASVDALLNLSKPTHSTVSEGHRPRPFSGYEVRIRVLGRVEIEGVDPSVLESGRRRSLTELASYMALRPGRNADQIARALGGPRGPWSLSTRNTHLSNLRRWLGRHSSGSLHFPTMGNNSTYSLAPTVGCDWTTFQELAEFGLAEDTQRATVLLEEALDLVTDEPFTKTGLDRYGWAEPIKPEINAALVDVAHTIATRHLRDGFLEAGRKALLKVLELDPACELLYRDLLRIEYKAGDFKAIDRAIQRLHIALDRLDVEMSEDTEALIQKLR